MNNECDSIVFKRFVPRVGRDVDEGNGAMYEGNKATSRAVSLAVSEAVTAVGMIVEEVFVGGGGTVFGLLEACYEDVTILQQATKPRLSALQAIKAKLEQVQWAAELGRR